MDYSITRTTKITSLIFLLLLSQFIQAQVDGSIYDSEDQNPIAGVLIYIDNELKTKTDENGYFKIEEALSNENYLQVIHPDYSVYDKPIIQNEDLIIYLSPIVSLNAIEVKANKKKAFNIRRMADVEGTKILAGKKNEVVLVENLVANTATNNARQVYAQVVGLNIFDYNDGGLQLGIGGRGLDPNRTSNFNTRQNGYDISADVLGYPESYYSPPTEALEEIQILRGAASLQYGTQFGGTINFKFKEPHPYKKFDFETQSSIGSYDLFTNFTRANGTIDKFSYAAFFNHKQGKSFRPNSGFNSNNFFVQAGYQITNKTKIKGEFTKYNYLAQQPGGLSDYQFDIDPTYSNRKRNWFDVDWNLYNLNVEHIFNKNQRFSTQFFALNAHRYSVGYRSNRISDTDFEGQVRDLIKGEFKNWGLESRFLQNLNFFNRSHPLLLGIKYYKAENESRQGPGSFGSDADFNFDFENSPDYNAQMTFTYPNKNFAAFTEFVFRLNDKFTLTPGARLEWIDTKAVGSFEKREYDLAGNLIFEETENVDVSKKRNFSLFGLGASYKTKALELYSNISQNYRSVTFSDIHIINPNRFVADDITDEKGYTFDLGLRGEWKKNISYDTNVFVLLYDNRIGDYTRESDGKRGRDNIGKARIVGLEWFTQFNLNRLLKFNRKDFKWTFFVNSALTKSEYLDATLNSANAIKGKKVEFVPDVNVKVGMGAQWKNLAAQLQYTYVSKQYTDADNSPALYGAVIGGIIGEIPAYSVMDLSMSYDYKNFKLSGGVHNLLDESYFVRRATGYPGPGIIPSNPRNWYLGLKFSL